MRPQYAAEALRLGAATEEKEAEEAAVAAARAAEEAREEAAQAMDSSLVSLVRQRGQPLLLSLHCNCSASLLRAGKAQAAKQAASEAL